MTFDDLRLRNVANVMLNVAHFGEVIAYCPAEGGPERSITVKISGQEERPESGHGGTSEMETIWVLTLRDESAAKGGIAAIGLGAVLRRTGDPSNAPWTFQGVVRNVTPHSWELKFARNRPNRYGPKP